MKLTKEQKKKVFDNIYYPDWLKEYHSVEDIEIAPGITANMWSPTWRADFEIEFYDEELNDFIHYDNESELVDALNQEMQILIDEHNRESAEWAETMEYLKKTV